MDGTGLFLVYAGILAIAFVPVVALADYWIFGLDLGKYRKSPKKRTFIIHRWSYLIATFLEILMLVVGLFAGFILGRSL